MKIYLKDDGSRTYVTTNTPLLRDGKQVYSYKFIYDEFNNKTGWSDGVFIETLESQSFCNDNSKEGFKDNIDISYIISYRPKGQVIVNDLPSYVDEETGLSGSDILRILFGFKNGTNPKVKMRQSQKNALYSYNNYLLEANKAIIYDVVNDYDLSE